MTAHVTWLLAIHGLMSSTVYNSSYEAASESSDPDSDSDLETYAELESDESDLEDIYASFNFDDDVESLKLSLRRLTHTHSRIGVSNAILTLSKVPGMDILPSILPVLQINSATLTLTAPSSTSILSAMETDTTFILSSSST